METPNDYADPWPFIEGDMGFGVLDPGLDEFPELDFSWPLESQLVFNQQVDQTSQWDGVDPTPNDFDRLLDLGPFTDFDFNMDVAQTDITNPYSVWTPSHYTGSIDCPSTTSDTSCLSPNQMSTMIPTPPSSLPLTLRPLAPLQQYDLPVEMGLGSRTPQLLEQQRTAATMATPSSKQRSARPRNPRRRHDGSFIPARQLRQIKKPVKCPLCQLGHDYAAGLQRHIAVHHKDQARLFNVSIARTPCPISGCSKDFARRDHALRHVERKHKDHDKNIKITSRGK
ncbi:hypothetical protein QBC41DRAFT_237610 [Cercophora samala]|uniref:C2H2-type domain-containing protein n=1 Tax=Cercophora samala TaxID=330535 RepID=A0AA40D3P4_9PEZI|nr:hypothetical protein QBC41DRAFT_237610 [Cercophora samala]